MPCTPAQRAINQAESAAYMRDFYASLGMRKPILERAIQQAKGRPTQPPPETGRRRGRPRRQKP